MTDSLNYPILIDQAMRSVVREVLTRVSAEGLQGEHHFYISFLTTYPGVKMSDTLKNRYPKEITIVLQHQFWDFLVEENQFQVTLSFNGVPEKLVVPFVAMTAFADPSVKFGLQFQTGEASADGSPAALLEASLLQDSQPTSDTSAEVISLDAFRKK